MAEDTENQGPKDTTPNPLEDAVKDKDAAAAEVAPAEGVPAEEHTAEEIDEGPEKPFIDKVTAARILQAILLLGGLYGLFLAIQGQAIRALPAMLGALCLSGAVVLDALINGKLLKRADQVETIVRYALAGVFFAAAVFFAVELKKAAPMAANKAVIFSTFLVALAAYMVILFIQIKKNKQKVYSDIYTFISLACGVLALSLFYFAFWAVVAMALSLLSLVCLMVALNKETIKDDENFNSRMVMIALIFILFVPMMIFSITYFISPRLDVLNYGTVSPAYKVKPENLSWSKHSWEMAYTLTDKKKKSSSVTLLNALTLNYTEFANEEDKNLKLPMYLGMPLWNNRGDFVVFSASDKEGEPGSIWGISAQVSLLSKEQIAKMSKKMLSDETKPVGAPKTLITDINKIIEKKCMPLTHSTAWSPDGNNFCLSALDDKADIFDIWRVNNSKQNMNKLTREFNKIMPLWAPSGRNILYVTKQESYTYLRVSEMDGKNAHELDLRKKADRDLFPAWNSEESRTIYLKGGHKLTIMNSNATNLRPLSKDSFTPSPYWLTAQRKKMLLDYTESGIIWKIYTMEPDGRKNIKIYEERCETMTQPKWDYDGKVVAMGVNYGKESLEYEDKSCIFRLEKDGSLLTRIYTGS
jgi:hypothetical protein